MQFLTDIWGFLKTRKKFWLLPLMAVLLAVGAILFLSAGSAIAPFIYTLF